MQIFSAKEHRGVTIIVRLSAWWCSGCGDKTAKLANRQKRQKKRNTESSPCFTQAQLPASVCHLVFRGTLPLTCAACRLGVAQLCWAYASPLQCVPRRCNGTILVCGVRSALCCIPLEDTTICMCNTTVQLLPFFICPVEDPDALPGRGEKWA